MNPERFKRITTIFERARKLDGEVRRAFLVAECNGDADLQSQVEAMLVQDERPGGAISGRGQGAQLLANAIGGGKPGGETDSPNEIPTRIGRYRVLRKVGEGGMGTVFEAEQDRPHRVVALKVIRPGLTTRQMLKRFEYEVEVLGHLRHPGIAQIFDAGTATVETNGGVSQAQPYFAMEFIRGQSLLDYAGAGGTHGRGSGSVRNSPCSPRSVKRCNMPISRGSFTATSNPTTSWWTSAVNPRSSISASPEPSNRTFG